MSYSEHIAKVVSDQLERFVTLNRHQLAGQVANLDFWIAQSRHALGLIDGYQDRFRRMKAGQSEHVAAHGTIVTSPVDSDIAGTPFPPRRVPDANLRDARHSVTEATYRFLVRLTNDQLISESQLRSLCDDLEIGIDPKDLRRGPA
jgi:hypothetical protein